MSALCPPFLLQQGPPPTFVHREVSRDPSPTYLGDGWSKTNSRSSSCLPHPTGRGLFSSPLGMSMGEDMQRTPPHHHPLWEHFPRGVQRT